MSTKGTVTFADFRATADGQEPRAEVDYIDAIADVGFVAPSASIDFVNLKGALTYVRPEVSVSYLALTATQIVLDPFLRLLRMADSFGMSDSIAFGFGPGVNEFITFTHALTFDMGKGLADSFFFGDAVVIVWSPIRQFDETVSINDILSTVVATAWLDNVTVSDSLSFAWDKVFSDSASVGDAVAKAVDKASADSFSVADALAWDLAKALAETLTMSDNLSILNTSTESSVPNESTINSYMLNH